MKLISERFHEVDLLRGIACLSVVAFHYLWLGPRNGSIGGLSYPIAESFARYGYLGVHLFFLISGFVILMSAQAASPRTFVASRFARLYPALWVGVTLTAGTAWVLDDARFAVTFHDYLVNLTMLAHWFNAPYVDGVYWSLAYELHFYIFVWLALRLRLMSRLQWLLAGWLVISAVNAARPMWPVEFWLNAKWAPFFTGGGVFYLIRTHGVTRARLGLLAASFSLALIYALSDAKRQDPAIGDGLTHLLVIATAVTAIFFVFYLIATRRWEMKASLLTYWAGVLTYPVYLIHQNFGYMIFEQVRKLSSNGPLAMVSVLVVVLVLSGTIHAFAERPLGRILRRTLDKHNRRNSAASVAEA